MLNQVYKIDENGYMINEVILKDFDEDGNCTEELSADIITTPPPPGLIRTYETTRWTGNEWISTMTEEEYIDTLPKVEKELTAEQRLAQLEALVVNNLSTQIENQIMKGEYHGLF